jgi:hypothetical protein
MMQDRVVWCGVMVACASAVGCDGKVKREEVSAQDVTAGASGSGRGSIATSAMDATLVSGVEAPYLSIERRQLTPAQLAAVERLEGEREEDAPHSMLLALDSPKVPATLRAPQRFTLITERGPIHTAPSRALVMGTGEQWRAHIFHVCDVPAGVSELKLGMVAVPYDATLPPGAKVRAGQDVDVKSAAGQAITAHVRTMMAQQREDAEQGVALDPAEHIRIVRGKFGGGETLLVTYAVPRSADGEDMEQGYFAGLFLTDDSGASVARVEGAPSFEAVNVSALVDLEGDGVDEVRFWVSYHEEQHEGLLYLKDGERMLMTLAGEAD